jgi:hypothetical protein
MPRLFHEFPRRLPKGSSAYSAESRSDSAGSRLVRWGIPSFSRVPQRDALLRTLLTFAYGSSPTWLFEGVGARKALSFDGSGSGDTELRVVAVQQP